MKLIYKTRNFYPNELEILKEIKIQKEKQKNKEIKIYHFIIVGILSMCIILIVQNSFVDFIFGMVGTIVFNVVIFMPQAFYNTKKKRNFILQQLTSFIEKGKIDTCQISAKRIAIAPEYEDENDLYIIELNENEVLYLWDSEYNLDEVFPCLNFEIYESEYFGFSGTQINALSEKIEPITIDKNAKWNFMKANKIFESLEIEKINFDELLEKYNAYS